MESDKQKSRIFLYLITVIIVIGFSAICFYLYILMSPPQPMMAITRYNESGIPAGEIISLSDTDLEQYPEIASVFRDSARQGTTYKDGKRIDYYVRLSWERREELLQSGFICLKMNSTTGENMCFYEYEGRYYSITPPTMP